MLGAHSASCGTKQQQASCLLQIKTQMTESIWKSKNALQTSLNMHPLGRVGEPEDVARAVEFFLHPANSFITGQVLGVDGGMCNTAPSRQGRDSA